MEKLYFIGTNGDDAIIYVNMEENISRIFWSVADFTYDATKEEKANEAMEQLKAVEDTSSWEYYESSSWEDFGKMFNPDEFLNEHFENVIYAELEVENLL